MAMRTFVSLAGAVVLAGALPLSAAGRPDLILVIVVDTLRADHMPAYGYARRTTPEIERVLAGGTIFEHSYAASSETRPSVTSILMGIRPSKHGYWNGFTSPVATEPNLPHLLRQAGYYTIGVNANPNTDNFHRSYDVWWGDYDSERKRYHVAEVIVEKARQTLKKVPEGKPLFLYLQPADPHEPYDPPRWDASFFRGDAIGKDFDPKFGGINARNMADVTPPVLANLINRYDAAIRYMDSVLAPFVAELMRRYPNHFIVFTADHGEAFLEHGDGGHGHSMYNSVLRVPLIVRDSSVPRQPARTRVLASGVDILPTILERAGLERDNLKTDGRSLLSALRTKGVLDEARAWFGGPRDRVIVSEALFPLDDLSASSRCIGLAFFHQAAESGRTVARLDARGSGCAKLKKSVPRTREWYDVDRDPHQKTKLRPRQANAAAIEPKMEALWPVNGRIAAGPREKLTPEEEAILRSLGYIQ